MTRGAIIASFLRRIFYSVQPTGKQVTCMPVGEFERLGQIKQHGPRAVSGGF
jgi:hypothetical protein